MIWTAHFSLAKSGPYAVARTKEKQESPTGETLGHELHSGKKKKKKKKWKKN